MSHLPSYEYSPLSGTAIRLIRLGAQQVQTDNIFNCDVRHYDVGSDSLPPYYAISYVWGSQDHLKLVQIDSTFSLVITSNLYEALFSIGVGSGLLQGSEFTKDTNWFWNQEENQLEGEIFLWADAISINQKDSLERSLQVPRMTQIYSSSLTTLIWFDFKDEPSVRDGHLIELAHSITERVWDAEPEFIVVEIPESYDNSLLVQYLLLSHNQWFQRLWVLQEYALSPKSICLPGYFTLDSLEILLDGTRQRLGAAYNQNLFLIDVGVPHIKRANSTKQLVKRNIEHPLAPLSYKLLFAFELASMKYCTVPHDTVYAMLGISLMYNEALPSSLIPNYELAFEVVYKNYVGYIVQNTGFLHILCHEGSRLAGVPTWVPDLSSISMSSKLEPSGKAILSQDGRRLTVHGILLGVIASYFCRGRGKDLEINLRRVESEILEPAAVIRGHSIDDLFYDLLLHVAHARDLPAESVNDSYKSFEDFMQLVTSYSASTASEELQSTIIAARFIAAQDMMVLKNGYLAVSTANAEPTVGDEVWCLKGSKVLNILRYCSEEKAYECTGNGRLYTNADEFTYDEEFWEDRELVDVTLI